MKVFFSGVGTRDPELEASTVVPGICATLSELGLVLRTGKAKGIDRLFTKSFTGEKELITPKMTPPDAAYEIAARHHGAWCFCSDHDKKVHAQNVMIFLGAALDAPVSFSLVWSIAEIDDRGGSALGMRVCREFDIPVFNIRKPERLNAFHDFTAPRFGNIHV